MEEHVRMAVEDGVAVVTLNRPEEDNAFSAVMGRQLGEAYTACDEDDNVRAVVLTGAGRSFCVGADLASAGDTFRKQDENSFSAAAFHPPAWHVRKPVIAAINGHAIGLGISIAMQCDIRVVAEGAKLSFAHVRRGVIPDAYSHWTVPRAVGFERAAELLLTGRIVSGTEAAAMGLASRAVPADEVLATALALARDVAVNAAPLSVALSKRLLWQTWGLSVDEMGNRETELHHHVMGKADAREGVVAFLERRPPQWRLSPTKDWPDVP